MSFLNRMKSNQLISKIFKLNTVQNNVEEPNGQVDSKHTVFSPTSGKVIPLSQVNDEVFKKEIVGKGVGIYPKISSIFSPVNGIVKYIPKSKHAIIISSDDGLDVLIHIGLDTVELNGEFFKFMVDKEQKVNVGDLLLKFDKQAIQERGYDITIPVIITNSNDFSEVIPSTKANISVEDRLIEVLK